LYEVSRKVYSLLCYGVKVQRSALESLETAWLIDWTNLGTDYFVVAEEAMVKGYCTKHSELIVHVNGIVFGVMELKRSKVSMSEGIPRISGTRNGVYPLVDRFVWMFASKLLDSRWG
jgi:putative DNA restriction-modification system, restriction enzyme